MQRRTIALIAALILLSGPQLEAATTLGVGSKTVDGGRVGPYEARWTQRTLQEGEWVDMGMLEEKATVGRQDEREVLLHTQIMNAPNGTRVIREMTFDRASLDPRHLSQRFENAPPQAPKGVTYRFEDQRIAAEVEKSDGTETFEVATPGRMFYGMTFGLVLAALPLEAGYTAELPASMPQMRATYMVAIEVVGKERYRGTDAWVVNTAWKDLSSGEVSPGGADKSGGAYWVIPRPPKGLPYVPKYVNDTVVIDLAEE